MRLSSKRAAALFLLVFGGCYTQASDRAVPAAVVNDACGSHATLESCAAVAGCEWRAVKSECPSDAACPGGVCVTPDACGQLADKAACEADTHCAWAGVRLETASIDLCLVGQSCDTGGYCRARDATGGGCTCVQPIACPANADCPAVECDCSNTPAGGGGGTCTCTCPVCAPGEACPPCACHCGGGACGGGGGGTCTCACPACAPGASCPPCDCACGAGNVGIRNASAEVAPSTSGGSSTAVPDACAGHGDAVTCAADSPSSCRWVELGIVCVTTPCPSGACVQVKSVPGGGGCGCACPACATGQSCPPCACDCCGTPSGVGAGPTPVPVPVPVPA